MTAWAIRTAQPKDAAALAACIDAAYAGYRERLSDLPDVSAGVANDIANHTVWVVELNTVVVGGLILMLRDDVALLANVAVDPSCGGQGIGRGLINHAEEHCRALGFKNLRLSTHVDMPENVALYSHMGWAETSRSGSKIHMTKKLEVT